MTRFFLMVLCLATLAPLAQAQDPSAIPTGSWANGGRASYGSHRRQAAPRGYYYGGYNVGYDAGCYSPIAVNYGYGYGYGYAPAFSPIAVGARPAYSPIAIGAYPAYSPIAVPYYGYGVSTAPIYSPIAVPNAYVNP